MSERRVILPYAAYEKDMVGDLTIVFGELGIPVFNNGRDPRDYLATLSHIDPYCDERDKITINDIIIPPILVVDDTLSTRFEQLAPHLLEGNVPMVREFAQIAYSQYQVRRNGDRIIEGHINPVVATMLVYEYMFNQMVEEVDIIAAILHDTDEDTGPESVFNVISLEKDLPGTGTIGVGNIACLETNFGTDVGLLVAAMTKQQDEYYLSEEFFQRNPEEFARYQKMTSTEQKEYMLMEYIQQFLDLPDHLRERGIKLKFYDRLCNLAADLQLFERRKPYIVDEYLEESETLLRDLFTPYLGARYIEIMRLMIYAGYQMNAIAKARAVSSSN